MIKLNTKGADRHAWFGVFILAGSLVLPASGFANGIAQKYPGDTGIGSDADVIFYEDFNKADISKLIANWTQPQSKEEVDP